MDNQRIILFFALSFVLLLLWQAWQEDYGSGNSQPTTVTDVPTVGNENVATEAPPAPASVPALPASAPATAPEAAETTAPRKGERILVETDRLRVEIDTIGGDLRQAELLSYPVSLKERNKPLRLMEDSATRVMIAQSGLLSPTLAPDHHAVFQATKKSYRLAPGENDLRVPLTWTAPDGIKVTKTYVFHRDSYVIEVDQRVENDSSSPWKGYQYRQLQRTEPAPGEKPRFVYTYIGGVIYSPEEKYEKIKFDDMRKENLSRDIQGGWAAMIQHYFLTAWIPDSDEKDHFYTKAPPGQPFVLGLVSPERTVAPGQSTVFSSRLFVGPKDQDRLKKAATGLELTVDYGVLTFIAQPLFWLLRHIHGVVHNWGWSVILLTLIIKLVFYKLSETSYKSMANMRRLQPKITALRERYGDDRQRMSQAMMELYKTEKINPLGGCLPIVVQIPVFISLYWVVLESVELRQAPFMFWIHDLSAKDPYYVLPVLMGITMFIQQRLNPPPPDPIQAKVLMALPFIFTLFFAFFPSGLVLYWVANSVLSILQQWSITRRIEKAAKR